MSANRFSKSRALRERAHRVIPGGAHTYSKGDDQFPEDAPGFIVRASGARAWDLDGNEFIDWGMGLRSVILGHGHPAVLEAVRSAIDLGTNFTRPSPIEVDLAGIDGQPPLDQALEVGSCQALAQSGETISSWRHCVRKLLGSVGQRL